jgi:hypothetical protein
VPFVWIAGFDYEAAVRWAGGDDLRVVGVLGGVFPGGSDDSLSPGELIGKINWRVELTQYSEFEVSFIIVTCSIIATYANSRSLHSAALRSG